MLRTFSFLLLVSVFVPALAQAAGEHGFTFLGLLPGHPPNHIASSVLVTLILAALTWAASVQLRRRMGTAEGGLVPPPKMNFLNFFEIIAESLYKLTELVIGHKDASKYFPLVGTLFVYIFTSNILGLIPGFLPPTDNINTTVAMGTFVFLFYNWKGIQSHGVVSYLKHFMGPVILLAPLIFVIELVSHLVRPMSLGLRLRGNMAGDHMVLATFLEMFDGTFIPVPVIFYGLGLFVSFIQAFVFCLLTMVYISMATSHDH